MAVMRRERIFIAKELFVLVVKYSAKNQKFTIEFPAAVAEAMHVTVARGSSEKEARDYFNKICKEYETEKTKHRKVIAYKIDINAHICEDEGDEYRVIFDRKDIHFSDCDSALGMGYEVLQESTIKDNVSYRRLSGSRFDLKSDWTVIDWTEERELFFKKTIGSLENLIMMIDDYFKNKEKLIEKIDQKSPLIQIGYKKE
jgi:hypothetical protein